MLWLGSPLASMGDEHAASTSSDAGLFGEVDPLGRAEMPPPSSSQTAQQALLA